MALKRSMTSRGIGMSMRFSRGWSPVTNKSCELGWIDIKRSAPAISLGNRGHLRDREADGRRRSDAFCGTVLQNVQAGGGCGQFDGDVRRPGMEAFGHRVHAVAIAGAQRIHLRADESRLPMGPLE